MRHFQGSFIVPEGLLFTQMEKKKNSLLQETLTLVCSTVHT